MHIHAAIPFRFRMPERRKCGVCHFFTKSVAMATSLEISKKKRCISIICTQNAFIRWKDCENRSSTSGDIWQNMPNPTWTRNAISICYLVLRRNYWTNLHQNFTRYSGSSAAINSCIYKVLVHSVSERQSNEWRWSILMFPKCSKINWLPWQCLLGYHKTYVSFVIPIHVTTYVERLTKIGLLVDDDDKIEAELQRNFHLLGCSPPELLDRSSPKFYTI